MAAPRSKSDLRAAAVRARAGCDPAWGERLAGHLLSRCAPRPDQIVSGFWPLDGEIDIRPLMLALAGRGHIVALPVTPRLGQPLTFGRWRPGDRLLRERFGTMRPQGEPVRPDVLLVPLLAFDRAGRRLGYGGGYYDRTLEALPKCTAIGCAFAAQELPSVPVEPFDRPLQAVVTEREFIRAGTQTP